MDTSKKHTIFIVDDDNFLLDMYALKFSQEPIFKVETALGSVPAYEKIKNGFVPEVMLLDIVMPVMDGFELLEKLHQENLLANTVVVILSNRGAKDDIERGEKLGVSGYIVKASSTPSEVINKVGEIVQKALSKS